ncbi:MAG: Chitodextrinase precursor [Bacteroidota bacterium]|jgi:uncharacterized protein (TIGR02145 family)
MKKVILMLLSSLIILSCKKKSEDIPPASQTKTEITVTESEVKTIVFSKDKLISESYTGSLDGQVVEFVKINDSTLAFYTPNKTAGTYALEVPKLNYKTNLVLQTLILTETPTQILDKLNTKLDEQLALADTNMKTTADSSLLAFRNQLSKASESEKLALAKYYTANKVVFDAMLNGGQGTNNRTAGFDFSSTNAKFKLSVFAFGAGVAVLWLSPDPIERALGTAVAYVGWTKARKYGLEVTNERLKLLNTIFDGIASGLRTQAAGNEFELGNAKTVTYSLNKSPLQESDNTSSKALVKEFFSLNNDFNTSIEKVNKVVRFLNDNLPFYSSSYLSLLTTSNLPPVAVDLNSETFSKMVFEVEDNRFVISASLVKDGELAFTFNAKAGTQVPTSVATKLKVRYTDDANDFLQKHDIVINKVAILNVDQTSITQTKDGGIVSVNVTSNGAWNVTCDQTWPVITPLSGNGNDKFSIVVPEYTGTAKRTATITISMDTLVRKITLTQEGAQAATITDIDGNEYKVVTIGTQTWMAKNLRTTKYNDGTAFSLVTDNKTWWTLTTPAFCYYNNDTSNAALYGALYNWYVVNTDKLCPTGWHVPTDNDWTILNNYIGANVGTKLKSKIGWSDYDGITGNGTDEFGFTALPANFRRGYVNSDVLNGTFSDDAIGIYTSWWSSSSSTQGWYLHSGSNELNKSYSDVGGHGKPVRCLKD